ncbi:MAG: hypothetical protein ACOCXT_01340 [Candidatus Dojkabacteria bacterium]
MDKEKLDLIIKKYNAQPVGNGYIDIIVKGGHYPLKLVNVSQAV